MLGIVYSAGLFRLDSTLVKVEVDVSNGLPGWAMVGLPEKAVQESKERVSSALRNSGIKLEARRTTINLAPATYKKTGNQYDLPIAMGVLLAHQVLSKTDLNRFLFVGELSLNGELKPIQGTLLFTALARQKGFQSIILPKANVKEASLLSAITPIGCESIREVLEFFNEGILPIPPVASQKILPAAQKAPDFSEVKGQALAKRGLEIAASGGHHIMMIGPPGSGKTMLASRVPSLLPPLTESQSLETTKIYSALGLIDHDNPLITDPPFRSPHHSISYAGLVGGGDGFLAPGEITLAHNGVLFMDELPEFKRDALQMLRQPLESHNITITRIGGRLKLPCRFQLVAAMNPCPCGYLGHPKKGCICHPGKILQYRNKISGPLMDRIDLHVETIPLTDVMLFENAAAEASAKIQERVLEARGRQAKRYQHLKLSTNSDLSHQETFHFCDLQEAAKKFFRKLFLALHLSARSHDKVLKVARTIADLAGAEKISEEHIAEAIQFRVLDKEML